MRQDTSRTSNEYSESGVCDWTLLIAIGNIARSRKCSTSLRIFLLWNDAALSFEEDNTL